MRIWISWTALWAVFSTAAYGGIRLTNDAPSYSQSFDALSATGYSDELPAGWLLNEESLAANATYQAVIGPVVEGNTYSLGSGSERALGSLFSWNLQPSFGAWFINDGTSSITSLSFQYSGEQWRLGFTDRADRLDFKYSTTAEGLSGVYSYIDFDALDFSSPVTAGVVGSLDGNATANRTVVSSTLAGLDIAPGQTIWIKWSDFNAAGGDDALGIDDFSITATFETVLPGLIIDAGQELAVSGELHVGSVGNPASLTINAGGAVAVEAAAVIDAGGLLRLAGGKMTADTLVNTAGGEFTWEAGELELRVPQVIGAGGSWAPAALVVDQGRSLRLGGPLQLTAGALTVGSGGAALIDGAVALDAQSSLTLAGGTLSLDGLSGEGQFNWESGQLVWNGPLVLAADEPLGAELIVDAEKTLEIHGDLQVGQGAAAGALSILQGGQVEVDGMAAIAGAGSIVLDGGALVAAGVSNAAGGALQWQRGQLQLTDGLTIAAGQGLGTNLTIGADQHLLVKQQLGVADGEFTVAAGGLVEADQLVIQASGALRLTGGELRADAVENLSGGALTWTGGLLSLTADFSVAPAQGLGAEVSLTDSQHLRVANLLNVGDQGVLSLGSGALAEAHTVEIQAGGTLALAGGTLSIEALSRADGAALDWQAGQLQFRGDLSVAPGGDLGDNVIINTGQNLAVASQLHVTSGTLTTETGGVVAAHETLVGNGGQLTINGGRLTTVRLLRDPGGEVHLDAGALAITSPDGLTLGASEALGASVTLAAGQRLEVATVAIPTGATLVVNGGELQASSLRLDGGEFRAPSLAGLGAIDFIMGQLRLTEDLSWDAQHLLGAERSLASGQKLLVDAHATLTGVAVTLAEGGRLQTAAATIASGGRLRLAGGALATGSLVRQDDGVFEWQSGVLQFTSDARVADGGDLGASLSLASGQELQSLAAVQIGDGVVPAELRIGAGAKVVSAAPAAIAPLGLLVLEGGALETPGLAIDTGGVWQWSSGSLRLTGDAALDSVHPVMTALGPEPSLGPVRGLTVDGAATLLASLRLGGGRLTAGTLVNPQALILDAGDLELTGGDLEIGSGGLFGDVLAIAPDVRVAVHGQVHVAADALVSLSDGARLTAADISNDGEMTLEGSASRLTATAAFANRGILRGSGFVGGTFANAANASVEVAAGERLRFTGPQLHNTGRIAVLGELGRRADAVFDGQVVNEGATSLITGADAYLDFRGGLTNAGSVAITGGDNHVFGNLENTGQVMVTGGATTTFYGNVLQNGELRVSIASDVRSRAVFLGTLFGAGGVTGGGEVFIEGELRPGNSPAQVTYAADVSLGANARLEWELGGTELGLQYDHLAVEGRLALGGALEVSLLNGFTPQPGDAFTLMTARDGMTGSFATVELPSLPQDWRWILSGDQQRVQLIVAGPDADFNEDGIVDGADFLSWQRSYGATGSEAAGGDANFDSVVDAADLVVWQDQVSRTPSGGVASVPEPPGVSVALVSVVAAAMAGRGRCRRGAVRAPSGVRL